MNPLRPIGAGLAVGVIYLVWGLLAIVAFFFDLNRLVRGMRLANGKARS